MHETSRCGLQWGSRDGVPNKNHSSMCTTLGKWERGLSVAMFSREIEMFLREMEILTFMPIPLLFFKKKHWIFKTKFIIGLRGQFSTLVLIYQGNSP